MKAVLIICMMFLSVGVTMAQETKKNLFVDKGDVIEATLFHNNGQIAQTGFYTKDNKLQGEWISFDVNGNKTAVAQYDNGQKVGTWLFYQGETLKEVSYDNSQMEAVKTYKKTDTQIVSNYK